MFRLIAGFSLLILFLAVQLNQLDTVIFQPSSSPEKHFSASTDHESHTNHESPNNSYSPVADDDTEDSDTPDTPSHSGDFGVVVSQVKFPFFDSHVKALRVEPHFTPWLITFDFERPPKHIS